MIFMNMLQALLQILKNDIMRNIIKIKGVLLISMLFFAFACNSQQKPVAAEILQEKKVIKYKVTFIELGSVRCIPCQQMQPVMKSIEMKYGNEVKVDFYDVWTEAGKPYGVKYGIEAIPTQVFLDESGKEFYRHVGFFPEEELVKVLQQKGVKLE
jgi:thioredoxin 1